MTSAEDFAVGMRVKIPWGLDEREGEVEAIYGSGPEGKLAVALQLPESDEPETLTFPARLVELVDPDQAREPDGHWLDAYKYWEKLSEAVRSIVSGTGTGAIGSDLHMAGGRSDIVVRAPDGAVVIIEAKASKSISEAGIRSMLSQVQRFAQASRERASALLVLPAVVSPQLADKFSEFAQKESSIPVELTTWRGDQDNEILQEKLQNLMSADADGG